MRYRDGHLRQPLLDEADNFFGPLEFGGFVRTAALLVVQLQCEHLRLARHPRQRFFQILLLAGEHVGVGKPITRFPGDKLAVDEESLLGRSCTIEFFLRVIRQRVAFQRLLVHIAGEPRLGDDLQQHADAVLPRSGEGTMEHIAKRRIEAPANIEHVPNDAGAREEPHGGDPVGGKDAEPLPHEVVRCVPEVDVTGTSFPDVRLDTAELLGRELHHRHRDHIPVEPAERHEQLSIRGAEPAVRPQAYAA